MKIVTAHQPAYMPWLGLFHKIMLADVFIIMNNVQFEKNSYINRNKILQNGKSVWLTIPVVKKDYKNKTISEIEVTNNIWKKKHFKTIRQAYSKSFYYNEVMPIIEDVYNVNSKYLIDYTNRAFFNIISYLEIGTTIIMASDLNISSSKLEYVIELTKKLAGDLFIFGSYGEDYADTNKLKENFIIPYFQRYNHPEYKQFNSNEFISHLSVLDLLFNYGQQIK